MFKKVKQIASDNWGRIVNIVLSGFVAGYIIGLMLVMMFDIVNQNQEWNINPLYPVPFATLFALYFLFSYFREELSDLEQRIEKHKKYQLENPTVSEFEQRFPEWYLELFDLDPDAFINRYCKQCATELRVATRLVTLEYDSTTSEPYKQKLRIFCPNECGISEHNIILINEKKKKRRLQGDDLVVVDANEEGMSQKLPPKLELTG